MLLLLLLLLVILLLIVLVVLLASLAIVLSLLLWWIHIAFAALSCCIVGWAVMNWLRSFVRELMNRIPVPPTVKGLVAILAIHGF